MLALQTPLLFHTRILAGCLLFTYLMTDALSWGGLEERDGAVTGPIIKLELLAGIVLGLGVVLDSMQRRKWSIALYGGSLLLCLPAYLWRISPATLRIVWTDRWQNPNSQFVILGMMAPVFALHIAVCILRTLQTK